MGRGLPQVVLLITATLIGLPLFFFALLAALDRFERSLSAETRVARPANPATAATAAAAQLPGNPIEMPPSPVVAVIEALAPVPVGTAMSTPPSPVWVEAR